MDHTSHHHIRDPRSLGLRLLLVGAALALVGVVWPSSEPASAASAKITICHRTHSETNPYRRITVSQSAVQPGRHGGHDLPSGSSNPDVYTSSFTYAPNNKYWGDVIPGATDGGDAYNGSNSIALNWTAAGQAIFFGSMCPGMSAKEFYDVELAADVDPVDIIADLNDMQANEDKALLAELGGAFDASNLYQWETAISLTTDPATSVTASTAVLNGHLDLGSSTAVTGFEWSTDPGLATYTSVGATPASVTGAGSVAHSLSGLLPATTYYYRVTGTTDAGLDTEAVLRGEIVSFMTPSEDTTTTSTTTTTTSTSTTTTSEPPTTTSTSTTEPPTTTSTSTTAAPTSTTAAPTSTTAAPTSTTAAPTSTTAAPTSTTAAPTSTTQPPSTTSTTPPPPPPSSPSLGRVLGVLWFDTDRDNVLDDDESILPGAHLELRPVADTAPAYGAGVDAASLGPVVPRTTISGVDGRYSFVDVEFGSYTVVASLQADGIERSFDTDGATDWTVGVTVLSEAPGVADFAGVGDGTLNGQLVDTAGVAIRVAGDVACNWAGVDGLFGTGDDSRFTTTASSSGAFSVQSTPFGQFRCGAVAATGQVSSSAQVGVTSSQPVTVQLALQTPEEETPSGRLPTAGVNISALLAAAIGLMVVGSGLIALGRRPEA